MLDYPQVIEYKTKLYYLQLLKFLILAKSSLLCTTVSSASLHQSDATILVLCTIRVQLNLLNYKQVKLVLHAITKDLCTIHLMPKREYQ
jgi:hypothetical protein